MLWRSREAEEAMVSDEAPPLEEPASPRRRPASARRAPYQAASIAAALAGGNESQARAFVRAVLAEGRSRVRTELPTLRARCVALVAAVLEAAGQSGLPTDEVWPALAELPDRVNRATTRRQLVEEAMGVLAPLGRKVRQGTGRDQGLAALNAIVVPRLAEGVRLTAIARDLGQHPTAITHRLQRKFGMSFSEYVGRLRVDQAKELLRRTRLTVSEVSRRVGINDASNFSRLFRKFEHMSPREYRQQYGQGR